MADLYEKLDKFNEIIGINSGNLSKSINLISFSTEIEFVDLNFLIRNFNIKSEFFYWSISEQNISFLAFEPVVNITENGSKRVELTDEKISVLRENFINNWQENNLHNPPLFFGGMKFAPDQKSEVWQDFSDSDWFIPRFLIINKQGKSYLIINYFSNEVKTLRNKLENILKLLTGTQNVQPSTTENKIKIVDFKEHNGWNEKVILALENISKGSIQKIVLSREVEWELSGKPDLSNILKTLSKRYPKCYVFAFKRSNSVFFGASPEKLAKISNGWIEADALAGSISRGKTEEDDKILENELLHSKKNLHEQQAVVEFITSSLRKISDEIIYDAEPVIRKLPNIQHLWTPIKAKLKNEMPLFSILKQLHPTPAICGAPWMNALKSITEMEEHDRGLYAGIVGWLSFENEAEFAVAIRSALYKENKIFAYAGCGIVEGSEPREEFNETELKLKPIKNLFVYENSYQPQ